MGLVTPNDPDGEPEPVLRRRPEVRRRPVHRPRNGRTRRDPRGLHPQRLRGRRREARHRPRADGRQPDDVRGLRPRLRAAVVRRQRRTPCSNAATVGGVSLHASNASASNCSAVGGARVDAADRHRPTDGHRRRRAGPAGRSRSTSTRTGSRAAQPNAVVPDLRGGPHGGPQRVPEPDRPGEPGQAGHPEDHEQGGAAERRRLRLAAPEPQRRRRRRAAAAVPVGRGHAGPGDRAVALLRAARLPAELRRPEEQHQHARDVRRGRPG